MKRAPPSNKRRPLKSAAPRTSKSLRAPRRLIEEIRYGLLPVARVYQNRREIRFFAPQLVLAMRSGLPHVIECLEIDWETL